MSISPTTRSDLYIGPYIENYMKDLNALIINIIARQKYNIENNNVYQTEIFKKQEYIQDLQNRLNINNDIIKTLNTLIDDLKKNILPTITKIISQPIRFSNNYTSDKKKIVIDNLNDIKNTIYIEINALNDLLKKYNTANIYINLKKISIQISVISNKPLYTFSEQYTLFDTYLRRIALALNSNYINPIVSTTSISTSSIITQQPLETSPILSTTPNSTTEPITTPTTITINTPSNEKFINNIEHFKCPGGRCAPKIDRVTLGYIDKLNTLNRKIIELRSNITNYITSTKFKAIADNINNYKLFITPDDYKDYILNNKTDKFITSFKFNENKYLIQKDNIIQLLQMYNKQLQESQKLLYNVNIIPSYLNPLKSSTKPDILKFYIENIVNTNYIKIKNLLNTRISTINNEISQLNIKLSKSNDNKFNKIQVNFSPIDLKAKIDEQAQSIIKLY